MSKTIVFFGSGPVAAASLSSLLKDFNVEAVVTKAVPSHHKGVAPVEELAKTEGLQIYFANTKTEVDNLILNQSFSSQVGIVVDYGVILSQEVINHFNLGIVNSHFSLLPRWRGADPITFAILSGDDKTGVSLMKIVPKLDEGDLLSQETLALTPGMTTPELTDLLIALSNKMLARDIPSYISGQLTPYPQPKQPATYSRKLTKSDGIIDWSKPAEQTEREIRAFIEWPKSRTVIAGKDVIITKAHVVPSVGLGAKPGDITVVPETKVFAVATGEGSLWIERLKPDGKNEMTSTAFLAGYGKLL